MSLEYFHLIIHAILHMLPADPESVPGDEVYEKAVNMATIVYQLEGEGEKLQFIPVQENNAKMLQVSILHPKKVCVTMYLCMGLGNIAVVVQQDMLKCSMSYIHVAIQATFSFVSPQSYYKHSYTYMYVFVTTTI